MLRAFHRELFFSVSLLVSVCSVGQSTPPTDPAILDAGVPFPVSTGILGRQDASALEEVLAHLKVVGAAPWTGMQGTGKIVYGGQDSTAYDATLSNLGGDKFRLDAQSSRGEASIRIHGRVGRIQGVDKANSAIPPSAAVLGIFPFELLRLSSFPRSSTALIDRGPVAVGGTPLHRITVELPGIGRNPATRAPETVALDLYFDPASHLLVKSATYTPIAGTRNVNFLRVVTYDDYRQVGASMVPFRYTESMEGQLSLTLQLSSVALNPALNIAYFAF